MARRLLLLAAGAGGAVLVRHVYLASVAFPNAVRAAGAQITGEVAEIRRYADQLAELGVDREKAGPLMAAHLEAWRAGR